MVIMQFMEYDLGHLNLIRATYICQSLARMGHQLSKLNDTPALLYKLATYIRGGYHLSDSGLCILIL